MRSAASESGRTKSISNSAREAEQHLREAGDAVNEGLRRGADIASKTIRSAAMHAGEAASAVADGANEAGRETYRTAVEQTGEAMASVDRLVSRNPVGALVAALGVGLVLGLMARK